MLLYFFYSHSAFFCNLSILSFDFFRSYADVTVADEAVYDDAALKHFFAVASPLLEHSFLCLTRSCNHLVQLFWSCLELLSHHSPTAIEFCLKHRSRNIELVLFNKLLEERIVLHFLYAAACSKLHVLFDVCFHIIESLVLLVAVLSKVIIESWEVAELNSLNCYADFLCFSSEFFIRIILLVFLCDVLRFVLLHTDDFVVDFVDIFAASNCKYEVRAF